MAALKTSLVEHILQEQRAVYPMSCGDPETPVLYSVGKEVRICATRSDAIDASAIIYAYSNAILLEALEPHVSILPPSRTSVSSNANKQEGIRVRPSTPQAQILVQLRPDDQFMISSRRFSLSASELDPVQFTPSASTHSTVVDLENEVGNTSPDLLPQVDGNVDITSASPSRPSLPGGEMDLLVSFDKQISPTRTASQQYHNELVREEPRQEQNGGPLSHDASSIAPNVEKPEQHSTLVRLEAQGGQENLNEQPPNTAQCHSEVQAAEPHHSHLVDGSTTPSSPKIVSRTSSSQLCETNLIADSGVGKISCEEDAPQPPNVVPQTESADTQTSTITRVDELLQLAGVDSDLSNSGSSPGENFPTSTSDGAHGRANPAPPYNLWSELKRKLKSPEKDDSLQLETPPKKLKTQETESGMESTIEVRPRPSRQKVPTTSKETRGVPAPFAELELSSPSRGTVRSQGARAQSYDGVPPRVLFSNSVINKKAHLMTFLDRQGGRPVKTVKECTILCVGPGELKKTSKLLLAVVSGRDIIRDQWLVDSARRRRLLDPRLYAAEDSDREAEWGTKLGDAIARGRAGTKAFLGRTIYFTPTLKKELGSGFLDLKEIAMLAGAAAVHARLPPKGAASQSKSLVLANSHDSDAPTLAEAGWTCYSKDIISLSVLQGRLNTESFRLDFQPYPAAPDRGRRRMKK